MGIKSTSLREVSTSGRRNLLYIAILTVKIRYVKGKNYEYVN